MWPKFKSFLNVNSNEEKRFIKIEEKLKKKIENNKEAKIQEKREKESERGIKRGKQNTHH